MDHTSFPAIATSLLVILNPLGTIPLFIALLSKIPPCRQRKIILREALIALAILLAFTFFGAEILSALGLSQAIVGMGGGIVLFLIALGMIFLSPSQITSSTGEEPLIVPMAMPLLAGPGTISSVIVYAEQTEHPLLVATALVVAWIFALVLLLLSSYLKHWLGDRGLLACTRFGGMLLTLISVNMFTHGVSTYVCVLQ